MLARRSFLLAGVSTAAMIAASSAGLGSMLLIGVGSPAGAAFVPSGFVSDGDSITAGTVGTTIASSQAWPAVFSTTTDTPTINVGVVGQTLLNMLTTYATNAAPHFSSINNALTILAGTNDLSAGTSNATMQTNIQNYCAQARTTGFKIYVGTIQARVINGTSWTSATEAVRVAYNTWLKANFASFSDFLIDFDGIPQSQNPSNLTYYNSDGLHPTAALNALMGALMVTVVGIATSSVAFNPTPIFGAATFSNNNKTVVTNTSTPSNFCNVLFSSPISGKKVFAVSSDVQVSSFAVFGVGINSATGAIGIDGNKSVGWYDNGSFFFNGVNPGSPPNWLAATAIGIIVDPTAAKLWVTKDGVNFFGSGAAVTKAQVAAGTNGLDISAVTALGTIYPCVGAHSTAGQQFTMIGFPFDIPSGYSQL